MKSLFALPCAVVSGIKGPRFWLGGLAAVALLGLGYATFRPADPPKAPPVATVAPGTAHAYRHAVQDALPDGPTPVDLYRFALNAFLLPLLDDAIPPNWTEVGVIYACGPATSIMVDGEPMVPGKPIPAKTFTVRLVMDGCSPMGRDSVELSGGVELVVSHRDFGLSAVVKPDQLRVDSHMGRTWLRGPFTAEAPLDTLATITPRARTTRQSAGVRTVKSPLKE